MVTREILSAALRFALQRFFAFLPSTFRAVGTDRFEIVQLVGVEKDRIGLAVAVDREGNKSPLVAGSAHAIPRNAMLPAQTFGREQIDRLFRFARAHGINRGAGAGRGIRVANSRRASKFRRRRERVRCRCGCCGSRRSSVTGRRVRRGSRRPFATGFVSRGRRLRWPKGCFRSPSARAEPMP